MPELERQIEKLAKVSGCWRAGGSALPGGLQPPHRPPLSPQRQMFFRKKLLHSSQTLRAASLGQDRFRRRYWVLPHLGGIFVEGAEGERGRGFLWGLSQLGENPTSHLLILPILSQQLRRWLRNPWRRRCPHTCPP